MGMWQVRNSPQLLLNLKNAGYSSIVKSCTLFPKLNHGLMRFRTIEGRQMPVGACMFLAGWLGCAWLNTSAHADILHRYSFEGEGTVAEDSIGGAHGSINGGARLKGIGEIDLDEVHAKLGD